MKKSKFKVMSLGLIVISIALFGVSIFMFTTQNNKQSNDYAPEEIDDNVSKLTIDGRKKKESGEGGAVSINYSDRVYVDSSTGKIKILFENPERSNQNAVLSIEIADGEDEEEYNMIAKSNMVPSGYALYDMDLLEDTQLEVGSYPGKIIITYYDEETKEKSAVELTIPALINVS